MYAPPAVELPKTSATVGIFAADLRVRSRKPRPPGMKISLCVGRSAPPGSTRVMTGSPVSLGAFAAGLDEVDDRQPVLLGDLRAATTLLGAVRVGGAAAHGRVVGVDEALDALDDADACDQAGADRVAGPPCRERRQLEKRRVRVEQQLDPLSGEHLAALAVPLDVLLPAATAGDGELRLDLRQLLEQRVTPRRVLGRVAVDPVGQHRHAGI